VITSNGTALSPELLTRLKQAGTVGVVFCLHGIDATHDAVVRHKGSFNEEISSWFVSVSLCKHR
jgi:MoaA/NifB/PqqE/SkfB family radical SAM enzyme